MISILCIFLDMQSFLMPPNYFDDGYLAIFLRQLSRRGLLLFYCSQNLTESDTPISFPLSFVPWSTTKKICLQDCIQEKTIICNSYATAKPKACCCQVLPVAQYTTVPVFLPYCTAPYSKAVLVAVPVHVWPYAVPFLSYPFSQIRDISLVTF